MTTLTIQPDATDGVDAMIQSSVATTNYGTRNETYIGTWDTAKIRALIKFDLSSIPSGSTIISAVMSYRCLANWGNTFTVSWYRVLRVWVEAQVTWNVYSTGNNWGTAGCDNTSTDRESTAVASESHTPTTPASNSYYDVTLDNAAVQGWVNGTLANNGLVALNTDESHTSGLYMENVALSDHATAAYRPKLVVVYTLPTPVMIRPPFWGRIM